MTMAGASAYQAEAFMQHWEQKQLVPEPDSFAIAVSAARQAHRWYPVESGAAFDRLGRVYSWRSYRQPFDLDAIQNGGLTADQVAAIREARGQALESFREAVELRPTAPGSWARLAHAKLQLREFDGEFASAYATAARLGAWRWPVNHEVAVIGFVAWPSLLPDQRELAVVHALRSMSLDGAGAPELYGLAAAAGVEKMLCGRASAEGLSPGDGCD